MGQMKRSIMLAAAGAIVAFLVDPISGKRRRVMARQRVAGLVRRGARKTTRVARHVASDAYGVTQRITHRTPQNTEPDDITLAQRIRSSVLRGEHGMINVNVEAGCAVLRGVVQDPYEITTLERRVRKVPGVTGVKNLVHLPNTPAPSTTKVG